MSRRILPFALVLVTTLAACASASTGPRRNMNELTREQITASNQMSALEVVQSERPHWLYRRGNRTVSGDTDIVVYLDGSRLGGPEALAHIPAINIERMRFLSEREAQFRYGVGHLHGAIEVVTLGR